MKLTQVAMAMLLLVGLSACETIDTPDGKIPSQYLGAAKPLVGTYQGHFNHMSGEFTLKLDGETPVLTYSDASGHDILGPECGSTIGKMVQVYLSDDTTVGGAHFAFDPGKCQIEGRTVDVGISQGSDGITLDVSIVRGHHQYWVPGDMTCWHEGGHHGGFTHCQHLPGHMEVVYDRISGSFKKAGSIQLN